MKHILPLLIGLFLLSCTTEPAPEKEKKEENYVEKHYTKKEAYITMRDGTKLFTSIYSPKDTSKSYPILLQRTPYSTRPYGEGKMRSRIAPSAQMMKEGYIVVYQDVRGLSLIHI